MGSRGRSIRLRIYFLVAIPLITMLGLFGYVAYTSVVNWLNLDRAPSLIQATSIPITNFVSYLQAERRAAVVYLSQPSAASLAAYQSSVKASKDGLASFEAVVSSPATTQNATPAETAALAKMVAGVTGMSGLRAQVAAGKLSPVSALQAYSEVIADQDNVFMAQAGSMTDTSASSQGLGLISAVNAREDLSEQDAVLAGALAANSLTGADRAAFGQAAGRQFDDTQLYQRLLSPGELASFSATMNRLAPAATVQASLAKVQDAVEAGVPLQAMRAQGLSPASWQQLTSTWQKASYAAATRAATATLATDQGLADSAKKRVWLTAGVGAAGLILTLIVSLVLSRSINRRLTALRRSALTLAHEQLPSVVARLRRGEPVDAAAQAPPLEAGGDEIGQVGQAIDAVRQTAIRSAIDEAQVRQGVNDMFRNLARRNQSLLQRQLTALDEAERRTTDPDVLEDLFRLDHLTTRMRRHAEGLIILSGAPPGRSWSAPVKLVDVMRGAVSEVEDYARVNVSTQARAALAGSAVTDVIHLLAELIENATTLSPPFTQVRVTGENVANGFAIEIEDRGLGMTPQRLAELNERLASPPDINPANTEQLGLFVVGELARRHGIRVVLRQSPYGGTSAVALIPQALIVDQGPPAITSGIPVVAAGARAGDPGRSGQSPYRGDAAPYAGRPAGAGGAPGAGRAPYPSGPAPARPADGPGPGGRRGRHGSGDDVPVVTGVPVTRATAPQQAAAQYAAPQQAAERQAAEQYAAPQQAPRQAPRQAAERRAAPQQAAAQQAAAQQAAAQQAGTQHAAPQQAAAQQAAAQHAAPQHAAPQQQAMPSGSAAPASPSFDVFTPLRRQGQDAPAARQPYPGLAGQGDTGFAGQRDTGFAAPASPGYPSHYGDPDSPTYQGDGVAYGAPAPAREAADGTGAGQGRDDGPGDEGGLPRRVRQASLAPQLRGSAAAPGPASPAAVPRASAASLTDMRNTLSAMQRGWQQGRSQGQQASEDGADGR